MGEELTKYMPKASQWNEERKMQAKHGWYGERGYSGLYICNNQNNEEEKKGIQCKRNEPHDKKINKKKSHAATDFFPGGCPKGRQREANTIATNQLFMLTRHLPLI